MPSADDTVAGPTPSPVASASFSFASPPPMKKLAVEPEPEGEALGDLPVVDIADIIKLLGRDSAPGSYDLRGLLTKNPHIAAYCICRTHTS